MFSPEHRAFCSFYILFILLFNFLQECFRNRHMLADPKIAEYLERMCLEARMDTLLVLIKKLAESRLSDQTIEAKAFNEGISRAIDHAHNLMQVIQDMKK